MKRSTQNWTGSDEHRFMLVFCEYFHTWTDTDDTWSANEHHFERSSAAAAIRSHRALRFKAINLASVAIPLDGDIEQSQRMLDWIGDVCRQQNNTGTRSENRLAGGVEGA